MVQTTKLERPRCFCTRRRFKLGLKETSTKAYELCSLSGGNPCKPCREAIELEARIIEAQKELEKLLCEETELLKAINESHEPFIHHLPLEISAYIFELSLPSDWPSESERNSMNQLELSAPLILGAVCHKWRSIAWSLPRLWTYLPIAYHDHDMSPVPSQVEVVAEWLSRSLEYPLSISFHTRTTPCSPNDKCHNTLYQNLRFQEVGPTRRLGPLIPLLNAESHRWKYLDIELPARLLAKLWGNGLGRPILDRLRVNNNQSFGVFRYGMFKMIGIQPTPSWVGFNDIGQVNINWENVATVDVGFGTLTTKEFYQMLQSATQLQYCSLLALQEQDINDFDPETTSLEVHNALQSLSLHTGILGNLSSMTVSLPALKKMVLIGELRKFTASQRRTTYRIPQAYTPTRRTSYSVQQQIIL